VDDGHIFRRQSKSDCFQLRGVQLIIKRMKIKPIAAYGRLKIQQNVAQSGKASFPRGLHSEYGVTLSLTGNFIVRAVQPECWTIRFWLRPVLQCDLHRILLKAADYTPPAG
jgi:hypothetical protein